MNKIILIGNLTKDPEFKILDSGIALCKFNLAVSRRFKNKNGEFETDFFPIIVWRNQAESCNKYLKKGSKAAVSGSVQIRTYEAVDGSNRYIAEVIANEIQFLNTKNYDNKSLESAKSNDLGNEEDLPF